MERNPIYSIESWLLVVRFKTKKSLFASAILELTINAIESWLFDTLKSVPSFWEASPGLLLAWRDLDFRIDWWLLFIIKKLVISISQRWGKHKQLLYSQVVRVYGSYLDFRKITFEAANNMQFWNNLNMGSPKGVSRISQNCPWTIFLPSSWFSGKRSV